MSDGIVWVSPPISSEEIYGVTFEGESKTPPLNLATLAAITRKDGFRTEIIDAEFLGWDTRKTAEIILEKDFKYVAITAVTMSIHKAAELASLVKKKNKEAVILVGGVHMTALPIDTMRKHPELDIGVIGEGDETISESLCRLEDGRDLSQVKGLVFRQNGNLVVTENRPMLEDLDKLPMPAWDMLPDLRNYFRGPTYCLDKLPMGLLITSRGCPSHCNFCDRSVTGNVFRAHSAEYVMGMIREQYHRHGIRGMHIIDSNFILNKKRVRDICKLLKEEKLDFSWSCLARVNLVTPEILGLMKDAGCWRIDYGLESGSQRVLDAIHKGITVEQSRQAVKWAKEAGLRVRGFFMLGNPTDTPETIKLTIDFAKSLDIDMFHFTFYSCFPGSTMYKSIRTYGHFEENWKDMSLWKPTFIPDGMTEEELLQLQKLGFKEFYLRPKVIVNFLRFIRRPRHVLFLFYGLKGFLQQLFRGK